jgi:acyl carrier protein
MLTTRRFELRTNSTRFLAGSTIERVGLQRGTQSMIPAEQGNSIRELIVSRLAPKLAQIGVHALEDDTDLAGLLIADSADLLDLIISVEEKAAVEFNPDGLDIEQGLTLAQLVNAFIGPSPQVE